MNKVGLIFIVLMTLSACKKKQPVPPLEDNPEVPVLSQQTDPTEKPTLIQNRSSLDDTQRGSVSISPAVINGISGAKSRGNEGVITHTGSIDKPSSLITPLAVEQVFNSDLLVNKVGGSDLYREYMADTLVYMNDNLVRMNKQMREEFSFLCDDPFCEKGLKSLDKLNVGHVAKMLYVYGKYYQIQHIAPINTLVLQGTVNRGPDGSKKLLRQVNEVVNTHRIDSIWINMSDSWNNIPSFMIGVGTYIRDACVDLRIIGQCSGACANYLIPATCKSSKVVVEPSGYFSYTGGISELYREMSDAFDDNKAALRQRFDKQYFSQGDVEGVTGILEQANHDAAVSLLGGFLNINRLNRFLSGQNKISWEELSLLEKKVFVSGVDQDTVMKIKNRTFAQSPYYQVTLQVERLLAQHEKLARQEDAYYEKLDQPSGMYSYSDLVRLSTALVKQPIYEYYFIVNRGSLDIPEKDKPYVALVPSAGVLRELLEIPMEGENHEKVMEFIYGNSDAFLMLDSEDINKCNLLSRFSFIMGKLGECLSDST